MKTSKTQTHLLETILAIRSGIGDGLADNELTRLLRETTLLSEAGFGFLCFSEGFVALSVPEQDLASWYPKEGWIAPEKEKLAKTIAEKHGLSLFEPIDTVISAYFSPGQTPATRHHLEFNDRRQTVVVAHPRYLKIRLFGLSENHRYSSERLCPLPLGPDLLKDLSALYSDETDSNTERPPQ